MVKRKREDSALKLAKAFHFCSSEGRTMNKNTLNLSLTLCREIFYQQDL
jgi:hypothetical protein